MKTRRQVRSSKGAIPSLSTPARLLLCDDQRLIRLRLRELLKDLPCFQIIGEADSGIAAVETALTSKPDLVLMDVSMPGLDGVEATRQIVSKSPGTRVLAFSADSDAQSIRKMFAAGASGYLLKTCNIAELTTAIQAVLAGERYVSHGTGSRRTRNARD